MEFGGLHHSAKNLGLIFVGLKPLAKRNHTFYAQAATVFGDFFPFGVLFQQNGFGIAAL
jgi:hypothetical protein